MNDLNSMAIFHNGLDNLIFVVGMMFSLAITGTIVISAMYWIGISVEAVRYYHSIRKNSGDSE